MSDYEDQKTDPSGASSLVLWARKKMQEHIDATGDWRQQSIDAFGLVAGDQWDTTVRNDLEADGRPVFTFNRVAGFIRGICGLEASTRNQVRFYAREVNDSGVTDVMNAAIKWCRDNCNAEDEEADAFKDMLICGLGWTETLYTTEEDPDGNVVVERIDPLHMRWDPAARKRGLADSRWRGRIKWLQPSVIRDVWGKEKADEVETMIENDSEILDEFASTPHDATAAHEYDADTLGQARRKTGLPVVQFQYVKTVQFASVMNPLSGQQEEIAVEDLDKLNARIKKAMGNEEIEVPELRRYKKRQYRQLIYCGGVELEDAELKTNGWTFNVITGIRDRNNGIWYGFVRDMVDPQRWINKFFSSMADVVASQAKGGLLAEADAFVSKERAAEDWADPRSIVWLNRGGLSKIQERQASDVPAGFSQLLEFTIGSLPHVAGVNLEFLGLAGREQAGVLETQRKQAAIATLSEFFNALRLYRKMQGRVLVHFINEYVSDGRLIRVVGKDNEQFVPLMKAQGTLQFDLVVDEAPDSPDQKGRTWDALIQILPTAAKMGFPIPPDIIKYAPFPQALVQDWQKFSQGEAGLPPEMKEKIQQMQEQLGAMQKENEQLKSKQAEKMAELQMRQQEGQQDAQFQQEKLQADIAEAQARMQLEREKAQLQLEIQRQQMEAEIAMQQQRLQAEIAMEQQKLQSQIQLEQQKAAVQAQQAAAQVAQKPKDSGGE